MEVVHGSRPSRSRAAALLPLLVGGWLVAAPPRPAGAHPLAPALLELRELPGGEVAARFKLPVPRVVGVVPEVVWPEGCAVVGRRSAAGEAGSLVEVFRLRCDPPGLAGRSVGVAGVAASRTDVVLRVARADGEVVRSLLTAARPSFRIPRRESGLAVFGSYSGLGARHILAGWDHLLFVLGLALLAGSFRRLLLTLSAFTVGHSVTLALAVLDVVRVAPGVFEVLIAASILFLGVELARPPGSVGRVSVPLAACFGLLHGLGFAGALREVGLPSSAVPLALFAFNAGIEAGQVAFVSVCATLWGALRRHAPLLAPPARWAAAYGIGTAAAYWTFERLGGLG